MSHSSVRRRDTAHAASCYTSPSQIQIEPYLHCSIAIYVTTTLLPYRMSAAEVLPRCCRRYATPHHGYLEKKGLSRCSAGMGLMGFRLPSGEDGDNCVLSISLRCATAFGCKDSMQLLLTCTLRMAVHFDLFLPIFLNLA